MGLKNRPASAPPGAPTSPSDKLRAKVLRESVAVGQLAVDILNFPEWKINREGPNYYEIEETIDLKDDEGAKIQLNFAILKGYEKPDRNFSVQIVKTLAGKTTFYELKFTNKGIELYQMQRTVFYRVADIKEDPVDKENKIVTYKAKHAIAPFLIARAGRYVKGAAAHYGDGEVEDQKLYDRKGEYAKNLDTSEEAIKMASLVNKLLRKSWKGEHVLHVSSAANFTDVIDGMPGSFPDITKKMKWGEFENQAPHLPKPDIDEEFELP